MLECGFVQSNLFVPPFGSQTKICVLRQIMVQEFDYAWLVVRMTVGLQWWLSFCVAYWLTCGAIVATQSVCVGFAHSEWFALPLSQRNRVLRNVLQNQALALVWLAISAPLLDACRSHALLPFWWPVSFVLFSLLNDAIFFAVHRAFHHPTLFRRYHAVHHELVVAFAPGGIYCHWLEMCAANLMQVTLPAFLLAFPDWAVLLFALLAGVESTLAHSRYSRYHFVHHVLLTHRFGSSLALCDAYCNRKALRGGVEQLTRISKRWTTLLLHNQDKYALSKTAHNATRVGKRP